MKKSILLGAAAFALMGAPAFAGGDTAQSSIVDCHAADMPKSAYNACLSQQQDGQRGPARDGENSQRSTGPEERQAGLSGSGSEDAGDNDSSNSDQPVWNDDGDLDGGVQDDGNAGGNDEDGSQGGRDHAEDWNRGPGDEDQSGGRADQSGDGYDATPDEPPQGDGGEDDGSDDDGSNA
jgi:hypothetical protein